MSLRPTSNDVSESRAVRTGRQSLEAPGHGAGSPGTVALFHSAHDLQFANSTFSVAGGDVIHNHNVHYHSERQRDIWGILRSIPNFRKIYLDMISKATLGTGMWLLEGDKFRVWLEPNGDIKIFWGSGIPGAGKTLLASIVIEHLEDLYAGPDAKICICYIYFRYSDHSGMTVRTILETLVMQTLERHPKCQALIEQAYARHLRERTEPTEDQLLALLYQLADSMVATFYILDALDEAPSKIQFAILKALTLLNVKLFITSRPLKTVEANFPQAHTFPIIAQDADIDLHITKGIGENAELQRLLQADPSLRDEIFSTIKQNCGGMFLHASLQLDALHECINAHQVKQRLKRFPSKIEDVYLQTWDRILGQNADLVSVAKAMLVWVLNASWSMTVEELERAVATSPDTYKFEPDRLVPATTLISLCRGLVTVEEESGIVRLVHYTARETLQKLLQESFPHPHSLLAAVCMTHLTECGFQNTSIGSAEEFELALNKTPLLRYAAEESWAFHARQSLDVDDSRCQIAQFINESKAFPVLIGIRSFDVIAPLHIIGLYGLPLSLIGDTSKGNPNVVTAVNRQSPLMVAARFGHEALVVHLIALSVIKVNLVDLSGWSALMWAASRGHEGVVRLLVAHPEIQTNLVDTIGWSALMRAASDGHEGIVELLLVRPELQVNLVNNEGRSALMLAASGGHEGVVKLLLAHPEVRVNPVDNNGWSVLIHAAGDGHEGVVKLLLAHLEIQVNLVDKNAWSALIRAAGCSQWHEGVVKLLLAHPEIHVNLVDHSGWSALMLASRWGYKGIVKLLLVHPELQVNLVDNNGWSALMWAASDGHEGVIKLLLAYPEIQVNLVSNNGRSALMLAAYQGSKGVVKQLLAHREIQVNLVDINGQSALMRAASQGHKAAVHVLLAHPEIQVNLFDNNGWSALMHAAYQGSESVVYQLLFHREIQINLVNIYGESPLMRAATSDRYESIIEILLEHPKIQVNLVDIYGQSALMRAAYHGGEGIVKQLLAHPEIQINLVDAYGQSALMWAAEQGNEGVVRQLLVRREIRVNLVDIHGQSALMWAVEQGYLLTSPEIQYSQLSTNGFPELSMAAGERHEGVVKLLMLHPQIQVNLVSSNGWSALMWAAYHGSEGVVKLLLPHPDIRVNLTNDRGSTALLLAAKYGRKGVVKCLLTANDIDINASDNDGDTAIKMSANNGHEAIVRLLLGAPNVNITIRSITDGHTAMSAALAKGHSAIVDLLQDFESRKSSMAGPPETSRLSLLDEDSSDSDSEEDYYDAEEGGREGDLELSVLTFD